MAKLDSRACFPHHTANFHFFSLCLPLNVLSLRRSTASPTPAAWRSTCSGIRLRARRPSWTHTCCLAAAFTRRPRITPPRCRRRRRRPRDHRRWRPRIATVSASMGSERSVLIHRSCYLSKPFASVDCRRFDFFSNDQSCVMCDLFCSSTRIDATVSCFSSFEYMHVHSR